MMGSISCRTGIKAIWGKGLCVLLIALLALQSPAQEEPRASALDTCQSEWLDLEESSELPLDERLATQTAIIRKAAELAGWTTEPVWGWIQENLDLWETSPDIELARETYLATLMQIGESFQGTGEGFEGEERLRLYFQRAMGLELTPVEEGSLLLYLAESWMRSAENNPPAIRRAVSLLEQAEEVLGDAIPMDAVHVHLGRLLLEETDQSGEANAPRLTEAVFHFRAVQHLAGARELYLEEAQAALAGLVQAELEVGEEKRYLPQNEIRLEVRSRNVGFLEVDLVPLSALGGIPAARMADLKQVWANYEPSPEQVIMSRRYPVRTRTPFDWTDTPVRLGGDYPGGWYGVRITGGGIQRKELLLVTTLELVAIPRPSGALAVWVADVEKGVALPKAEIQVLDTDGAVLSTRTTDDNGYVLLEADAIRDWAELQVLSADNPALLVRESLVPDGPRTPWVIPGALEAAMGQELPVVVLAPVGDGPAEIQGSPRVILPDERVVDLEAQAKGPGWVSGTVALPETGGATGPLYMELSDNKVLFGHVTDQSLLPLEVKFTGERLRPDANLFLNSSSLGIQLEGPAQAWDNMPEYIRLRISSVERARNYSGPRRGQPVGEEILMENIFAREDAQSSGTLVALPDLLGEGPLLLVKVEALSLDEDAVLGRGFAAFMGYRRVVRLKTSERIIHDGGSVSVDLEFDNLSAGSWYMNDGDLAIYRETWESRYIHRKKGNLITESEYMILPDRSLLGAAKTDFRLAEQGYVREEVQRIPVKAANVRHTVPINFDLPGYYRIEFENGEAGLVPEYVDGPLELWVLPDSGDLHAFRAKQPRAIVEQNSDGSYESLLLLDRTSSVLMDFEHADGQAVTRIVRPEHPAVAFNYTPGTDEPLTTCRFLIIGDRRSDYLWKRFRHQTDVNWEIESTRRIGVTSGDSFKWPLHPGGVPAATPVFWTFLPDGEASLVNRSLYWQSRYQAQVFKRQAVPVMLLEHALPLFHPLNEGREAEESVDEALTVERLSSLDLLALYPEIRLDREPGEPGRFSVVQLTDTDEALFLAGSFPQTTGRWRLELFGQSSSGDLGVEEWSVSTDQPIRIRLDGPPVLRLGDRANLLLELKNTTRNNVDLELGATAVGNIRTIGNLPERVSLPAESGRILLMTVEGDTAGTGKLSVKVAGSGSQLQVEHTVTIEVPGPISAWQFKLVPPQNGMWSGTFNFTTWESGQFVAASGLGSLLPQLWPLVREAQGGQEPVLTALGDWALSQVIDRHGLPPDDRLAEARNGLLSVLSDRQGPDGGWGWSDGAISDPWLSALILWTLDTFGATPDDFLELGSSARQYLEDVLVDNTSDTGVRLFTLRALSAQAFHSENARPTRIQARSFLEFLYQREDLNAGELAMLLEIASAFSFREEITLLGTELKRLQAGTGNGSTLGFFPESLVFLSFNETSIASDPPGARLERVLMSLAETGPQRSWEQVGGILNLMSAFYWRGEFNIDGQASVVLNGEEMDDLVLNPDTASAGLLMVSMEPTMLHETKLEIDTTFALSPVILAFFGMIPDSPDETSYPNYSIQLFREYEEATLLAGSHLRQIALDDAASMAQPGEVLRLRLSLRVQDAQPYAEFCFPVPAGLSLDGQEIRHSWESIAPERVEERPPPNLLLATMPEDSCRRIRLVPLEAGTHVLEIPFRVQWSGTFAWPDNKLVFPKSGQSYRIANSGPLQVNSRED